MHVVFIWLHNKNNICRNTKSILGGTVYEDSDDLCINHIIDNHILLNLLAIQKVVNSKLTVSYIVNGL